METIGDGQGNGYLAGVSAEHRLKVIAKSEALQHVLSQEAEQAYQCIGVATLASGTVTALHIENTSVNKNMVVTYARHQIIGYSGGTAFPNTSNYFRIALGRSRASGGTVASPVNVFSGSGNEAEVTAYQGAPTLAGTAREIDRWYTKAEADMNPFNKEGAVILAPKQTIELSYVGDQTAGIIYSRISFLMEDPDGS